VDTTLFNSKGHYHKVVSLRRLAVLIATVLLTVMALPAQATGISTDYQEFTYAATYYFNADFYGYPVYFPSWAQEHVWDRHVLGYERDYKEKTTFYPLGQYVAGRKLPETMDGYDVVYLIEETIEYGNPEFDGDRVVLTYDLPGYEASYYGIDEMKAVIQEEEYDGYVYFEVVTAYPVYGPDVAVYEDHHWVD